MAENAKISNSGKSAGQTSKGLPASGPPHAPSRYISPLRQKRTIRRYYGEDRGIVPPQ